MTNEVRVGDVLDLQRRRVSPTEGESYREIGLRSFGKGVFHKTPTTASEIGTKKVFRIEPGDFLISNVFAWEGAVAVASEEERGLIGSHRFMTWTPKRLGEVDVHYLRHYFGSDAGLAQLRRASPGSAGRNRTLSIAAFQNLVVPFPDFPEQRKIAITLDRLEHYLTSLTMGNGSGRRALTLMPRVLGQQLDSFNWPAVPVSDLCTVVSDVLQPQDDAGAATEFVGLEFIRGHTGQRVGSGPTTNRTGRKLRFNPGDVLYGYLRPYQNKVWAADRPGLCSVEQYVLRPLRGVRPELLSLALRSSQVLDSAIEQTNSLQLPRLGVRSLLRMQVPDLRLADAPALESLRQRAASVIQLSNLLDHRSMLEDSLLPAARNEAFSRLR